MRDTRSLLLTIVSILLIVVSMALLWSWGYNYGNKKKQVAPPVVYTPSSPTIKSQDAATLKKMYDEAKNNLQILNGALGLADSLKIDMGDKMKEFYTLRDQLANLLGDPESKSNIINAIAKISELQKKVERLKKQNLSIEKENKRLAALLAQLSKIQAPVFDINDTTVKNVAVGADSSQQQINTPILPEPTSAYVISKIGFDAYANNDSDPGQTTEQAATVNKLKGSFDLQNNHMPNSNGEFVVVVTQPDGRVLKASTWESGTFETNSGRKIYTCKVKFECNKGEMKSFGFKVEPNEVLTGTYQMQLYYNKEMIASATKTLH